MRSVLHTFTACYFEKRKENIDESTLTLTWCDCAGLNKIV